VICFDEFGPLELRPRAGCSWQPRRDPHRQRATYTRRHGVRHLLAVFDVRTGQMCAHVKRRKRAREFLTFLKAIRRKYTGRLWIVLDNLKVHKTEAILQWARQNNVRFQYTPTDASWLNRIECQFTHVKRSVLTHCDYDSFEQMRVAIQRYLRWHNRRKERQLKLKRH
jgi:transposase